MARIETWFNHDLSEAVKVQYLDGNLFSMDNQGNAIFVRLTQDGEPYAGGGSVSANVIRSDGGTVACPGVLYSDVASVVLPQAAYAVPGVVSIIIKVTIDAQVTTVAAIVANVYQSSTDTVIDPGTIIPSIQTLISQINTAVSSIPADYSSLWTSLAPAFSTSTAYTAGQYVTYDGGLYRFTTDHAAGSWSSSDVSSAKLGNDLTGLKSAINDVSSLFYNGEFAQETPTGKAVKNNVAVGAYLDYTKLTDSENMASIVIQDIKPGMEFLIFGRGSANYLLWSWLDSAQLMLSKSGTWAASGANGLKITAPQNANYLVMSSYTNYDYGFSAKYLGSIDGVDARIDGVDARIDGVDARIDGVDAKPITLVRGHDFVLNSTSVTMENGVPVATGVDNNYRSGYVACVEGDKFLISGLGGVSARLYAFVNSEGTILQVAPSGANYSEIQLTAPAGTAFLCLQSRDERISYYGLPIKTRFENVWEAVDSNSFLSSIGYFEQQTQTGQAIKNNVAVGAFLNIKETTSSENQASIVVSGIEEGMSFRLFGRGSANYLLWSWLDEDMRLISKAAAWTASGAGGLDISAPENAKYLVSSSYTNYDYGYNIQYLGAGEYLNKEIQTNKIGQQVKDANFNTALKFAFFSDVHNSSTNVQHIIDYAEKNGMNAIINGGDTVLQYLNDESNPFTWYATMLSESGVDVLSAVGNHDVWGSALWSRASNTDIYNAIVAPIIANFENIVQPTGAAENGLCYYYKDYDTVRVIIINAMSGHASVEFWDANQKSWLESVLADAKTNSKHVIICNHSPFPKNIAQRNDEYDWNSWIDYRTWASSDGTVFETEALDVIKAFVDDGGTLVCLMTGHEHVDNILTATGYSGMLMVNIASARYGYHSDGKTFSSTSSPFYDCFDVCAVDTTNHLLKIQRIGWNTDFSMKVREYFSYRYDTKNILVT